MANTFTPRAQQSLARAREEAERRGSGKVDAEHLLLGLLSAGPGAAVRILQALNVDPAELQQPAGPETLPEVASPPAPIPFTEPAKRAILASGKEAERMDFAVIGTQHLLLALLQDDGPAGRLLRDRGLDLVAARRQAFESLSDDA